MEELKAYIERELDIISAAAVGVILDQMIPGHSVVDQKIIGEIIGRGDTLQEILEKIAELEG